MKKYILSIACSFVFLPLMAWQSSLPRVGSVINIPSSVDYEGVTNVVTNVVTKGYVEGLGIKADGEKISKNGYYLTGDLTFGALPITRTNDFVSANADNVYKAFGSYAPTNFTYIGLNGTTGIWQCVYHKDGVQITNVLKCAYDKMSDERIAYWNDVISISGLTNTSEKFYQYTAFNPKHVDIGSRTGGIIIAPLKFYLIVTETVAGVTTQYFILYDAGTFFCDTTTKKVLVEGEALLVADENEEATIGLSHYNPSSCSIEVYATNQWYKYTLSDTEKTNSFFTTKEYTFTNTVSQGSMYILTEPVYGSKHSGSLANIDGDLVGYISTVDDGTTVTRQTLIPNYDEFGTLIGYSSYINPTVEVISDIPDYPEWISVDKGRDEAYLAIATDRVKNGVDVATNYVDKKIGELSGNFLPITNDVELDSVDSASPFIPTNSVWYTNEYGRIYQQPFVEYCKYTNTLYGVTFGNSKLLYFDKVAFNDSKYDLLFSDVVSRKQKTISFEGISIETDYGITSLRAEDISHSLMYAIITVEGGKVEVQYILPTFDYKHTLIGYYTTNIVYDTYDAYTNASLFFSTDLKFENGFFGQGFFNQSFATISDLKKIPDIVDPKVTLYGCTGVSEIDALETYAANTNYPYGTYIYGPDGKKYICTNDISMSSSWGVDSNCFVQCGLEGLHVETYNNVTITNELKQGTFVGSLFDAVHYSDLIVVFKTKDVAYPFYLSGPNYTTHDGGVTWERDQRYSTVKVTVSGTTTVTQRPSPLVFGSEETHCIRTKPNTSYTVYVRYIDDFKVAVLVHEDVNLSTKDAKVTVSEASSLITNTVSASYISDTGIAASNETTHAWQKVFPVIVNGAVEWRVKE